MKNFIQEGEILDYLNSGSAITSGSIVVVGEIVCVAAEDIAATTGTGALYTEGVFSVTKVGSQAWTVGDKVFWDKTNLRFTKTASSDADLLAGVAVEAAGSGSGVTTGKVLLIPGYGKKAASVADVSTADGSDATTTQALANALKVKINALLAALRADGVIDT